MTKRDNADNVEIGMPDLKYKKRAYSPEYGFKQ
jgi:hypothetical protein